jgi:hypothetical protein
MDDMSQDGWGATVLASRGQIVTLPRARAQLYQKKRDEGQNNKLGALPPLV